jgi:hypothetical protein
MANKNTPTQKELLARIRIAMADDAEVVAYCDKKIAQLSAKATSANSKKSAEDEKYFIAISEVLAGDKAMRATEILNALSSQFEGLTIQKVTSMLTKMVANGEVVKTVEKKVSTFSLAPVEVDEG